MKFILVFVALFCLAHCQPIINEESESEMSPDKEFETVLNTKEDEEVPIEYNAKQEDKHATAQLFKATTCRRCLCSKRSRYGYAAHTLCYQCSDYTRKYWRHCIGCYCSGGPYSVYDTYYAFCRRCYT